MLIICCMLLNCHKSINALRHGGEISSFAKLTTTKKTHALTICLKSLRWYQLSPGVFYTQPKTFAVIGNFSWSLPHQWSTIRWQKNSTRFYSENFGKREVIKLDTLWSQVKILKELTNTNANS